MNYALEHAEALWVIATGLLSFSFGCGITYWTIRETRRHVNGLGGKVTRMKEAMLLYWPEDTKDKVAHYIK